MSKEDKGGKKAAGKKKAARRKWRIWPFLLKLALVGAVVLASAMVYLDAVVQERFAGKRWTVPARVYARPLELYAGQRLQQQDFVTELQALGYRRGQVTDRSGVFSVSGNRVELFARGFRFYDGKEPAQRVRVSFSGNQVASL